MFLKKMTNLHFMEYTCGLRTSLEMKQSIIMPLSSSTFSLSPSELEEVLDESLEFLRSQPTEVSRRGNFMDSSYFREIAKRVGERDTSPLKYIEEPQITVRRDGERFISQYDAVGIERVYAKLKEFKSPDGAREVYRIFTKRVSDIFEWTIRKQIEIVDYLTNLQSDYLESLNPFDLKPYYQENMAEHFGISSSTVSRLLKNLAIEIPEGPNILAFQLAPGMSIEAIYGIQAMKELRKDPELYDREHKKWKVSCRKLVPIIKERFNLDRAGRTLNKYQGLMNKFGF